MRYLIRPLAIKGIDKLVYEAIYEKIYDFDNMMCKYTYRQIAEAIRLEFKLEYNPKQIMNSINKLVESGYLQVLDKGKKGTPTTFKIIKIEEIREKQIDYKLTTNKEQINVEIPTVTEVKETEKKQIRNTSATLYNKKKKKDINIYTRIVENLNSVAHTNYRASTKKTQSLIDTRVKEGFNESDFMKVIEVKANEWIGTEFERFLRPETLFGNKFEGYLNQANKKATTGIVGSKNNKLNSSIFNSTSKNTQNVKEFNSWG